jgi:hypothetical protein
MEPTQEQLNEWYELYGPLFTVRVTDKEFLCKELSRKRYKQIAERYEEPLEQEEAICSECVLWPKDPQFDEQYAGLPTAMANEILTESGFGGSPKVAELMDKYTKEMDDFMNQVSCEINEAFPLIDLDEIEGWNLEKTLWYLSRARWKLREFRGYGPQAEEDQGDTEGSPEDFPELAEEKAFMSGKMTKSR